MNLENQPRLETEPQTVRVTNAPGRKTVPGITLALGAFGIAAVAYGIGRVTAPATAPSAPTTTVASTPPETGDAKDDASAGDVPIELSEDGLKTAGITIASVRAVPLAQQQVVPGTVEVSPNRAARVTPPVAGKVITLFAAPGDRVSRGQRLALLDSPEIAQAHAQVREAQARVAQAEAQVQTAQASVEQALSGLTGARATLARQRELARAGAFSQPSLQTAQNEMNTAQSELRQIEREATAHATVLARTQRLYQAELVARTELEATQAEHEQDEIRRATASQRVALAKQALEREQRVFSSGVLTRQAVQTAEASLRAAEGDVRQARKQLQAAQTVRDGAVSGVGAANANLHALEGSGHAEGGAGRISLYAPLDGTVATRGVTPGQAVERSSDLFTLQNLEAVLVQADVPEASLAQVRVGASVQVTVASYPGMTFHGTVQSVGSQVDPKTRALPVRCLVQNPGGKLKPEMFAQVRLAVGQARTALVVPASAIDEDGDQRFVYVQTGPGTFAKRTVTTGRVSAAGTEIVGGITRGEKVVTDGVFVLKSESKKDELKGDD